MALSPRFDLISSAPVLGGSPVGRTRDTLRRARRKAMSIVEVMVVLVIAITLIALLAPSLASFFMLEQRQAAKDLTLLYSQLHDEAVMRNVTFRIAYDLRQNTYEVQVGESGALIFDDATKREEFEEDMRRKVALMNDEEKAEFRRRRKPFETLGARFKTKFELPRRTIIGGVYTPQYEEMITIDDLDDDDEIPAVVYSYIFPNGQAEHTVVWLVDEYDHEDGFTIEIEPLSGAVHLSGELIDWRDSYDFVPDEGPTLPTN